MDVIIQSLGFKHSESLEQYINQKLQKLTPADRIIRANVTMFQGPDRATPNDYCEIRLEVPGPDIFVKESALQFEQAVDECINKVQSILRKNKRKWWIHTNGPELNKYTFTVCSLQFLNRTIHHYVLSNLLSE